MKADHFGLRFPDIPIIDAVTSNESLKKYTERCSCDVVQAFDQDLDRLLADKRFALMAGIRHANDDVLAIFWKSKHAPTVPFAHAIPQSTTLRSDQTAIIHETREIRHPMRIKGSN